MDNYSDDIFRDETVKLDGKNFTGCKFIRCNIVYSGGTLPVLDSCLFKDCRWTLEGAADRTAAFMKRLHQAGIVLLVKNFKMRRVIPQGKQGEAETD